MSSRIVIYLRTSTDQQNPESQLSDCLSINKYGEPTIIEEKQSAWKDDKKREEFEKILSMIKRKEIDHLIVWDLDRIYRNRKNLKGFMELLKNYKVQLHSVRQTWLEEINMIPAPWNDIVYDMLINIFGWIAEEESSKKSDRVRLAIRKKNGKTLSYKGNTWGRKPISTQARNKILELAKQGLSLRKIAAQVTYTNKNHQSVNVTYTTVKKILDENMSKKVPIEEVLDNETIKTQEVTL